MKKIPIELNIVGNIEDKKYWSKCSNLINKLKHHMSVKVHGHIHPSEIPKYFHDNDLFILLTKNENYGHAIVESLQNGCPVLISRSTPWNDIEKYGAGYVVDKDNITDIRNIIENFSSKNEKSLQKQRNLCYDYFNKRIKNKSNESAYLNLFNN